MIWTKRWPNFAPHEVLSPRALKMYEDRGIIGCNPYSLDILQAFRKVVGIPIKVNHHGHNLRGYRTPKEHISIKSGALMSPHPRGEAFDCSPVGMSLEEFFNAADSFKEWLGIGRYETFIHLDTWDRTGTGQRAYWNK